MARIYGPQKITFSNAREVDGSLYFRRIWNKVTPGFSFPPLIQNSMEMRVHRHKTLLMFVLIVRFRAAPRSGGHYLLEMHAQSRTMALSAPNVFVLCGSTRISLSKRLARRRRVWSVFEAIGDCRIIINIRSHVEIPRKIPSVRGATMCYKCVALTVAGASKNVSLWLNQDAAATQKVYRKYTKSRVICICHRHYPS